MDRLLHYLKGQTAGRLRHPGFIRTRILSLTLVVSIGFLLVFLVLNAGLTALGSYLEAGFPGATVILHILNSAVAFGAAVLLFAIIFKILPDLNLAWRDVWIGAVVTSALFTMGKFLIGLYLGAGKTATSYGAAANPSDPPLGLLLLADSPLWGRVHQSLCRAPRQPD